MHPCGTFGRSRLSYLLNLPWLGWTHMAKETEMTVQNTSQHTTSDHAQRLGGALIDEKGREIPITEAMIQKACREPDDSLKTPTCPE